MERITLEIRTKQVAKEEWDMNLKIRIIFSSFDEFWKFCLQGGSPVPVENLEYLA